MLFSQNELINPLDEAAQLLESSQFLNESESAYQPYMVPIRESKQYGSNLIKVEDLVEYSLANGIIDANYAIDSVCEANDIEREKMAEDARQFDSKMQLEEKKLKADTEIKKEQIKKSNSSK
jgi:hypothetical protein